MQACAVVLVVLVVCCVARDVVQAHDVVLQGVAHDDSLLAVSRTTTQQSGQHNSTDGTSTRDSWAVEAAAALVPLRQLTVRRPLVFYHARKCGGTSLRAALYASAAQHWPTTLMFMPDVNAPAITMGALPPAAIEAASKTGLLLLGGHLAWGAHHALLAAGALQTWEQVRHPQLTRQGPSALPRPVWNHAQCVTLIRHPLERTISCYYYRLFERQVGARGGWHLWELSPEDITAVLGHTVDRYGHGCLNELIRTFSGSIDEAAINRVGIQRQPGSSALHPQDRALVDASKHHLAECIIGTLHDWPATTQVFNHFLPWLQVPPAPSRQPAHAHDNSHANQNMGKPHNVLARLSTAQRRALEALVAAEVEVFDAAVALHTAQARLVLGDQVAPQTVSL